MPNQKDEDKDHMEERMVILMKNELINLKSENLKICTLPHSRTGEETVYFTSENGKIYEVITQNKGLQSWFIDDDVEEDGSLYITSEVDILFVILPYFMKSEKFCLIEDLDVNNNHALNELLSNFKLKEKLLSIADMKHIGEDNFYRYSDDKTLNWCEEKILKMEKILRQRDVNVYSGSRASTFVSADEDTDKASHHRYAVGLLTEYLPEQIGQRLMDKFGYNTEKEVCKDEPAPKRQKLDKNVVPKEDYAKNVTKNKATKKAPAVTTAQKKLVKGDMSGMKKLHSFFKKS
ncbi:Ribonuclease H2 subunit B [Nymphon striatum]|nr:Ribonuclease H2 subunit B [Nymphon striatum]